MSQVAPVGRALPGCTAPPRAAAPRSASSPHPSHKSNTTQPPSQVTSHPLHVTGRTCRTSPSGLHRASTCCCSSFRIFPPPKSQVKHHTTPLTSHKSPLACHRSHLSDEPFRAAQGFHVLLLLVPHLRAREDERRVVARQTSLQSALTRSPSGCSTLPPAQQRGCATCTTSAPPPPAPPPTRSQGHNVLRSPVTSHQSQVTGPSRSLRFSPRRQPQLRIVPGARCQVHDQ